MNIKQVMGALHRHPIAHYPIHTEIMGSTTGGVVLSQLLYWLGKKAGEIWKTDDELREESGITVDEMKAVKRKLKSIPFLSVKRKGIPAKTYYEIDWEQYAEVISGISTGETVGIPQTRKRKSRHSPSPKEKAAETTTENTTETCNAAAGAAGVSHRGNTESSSRFRKLFMRQWRQAYRGEQYPLNAREATIAKRIWDRLHHDMRKARSVLTAYFACTDRFFEGHSLGLLSNQLPKFLAGASSLNSMSLASIPDDVWPPWLDHAEKWIVPKLENEGKPANAEHLAVVLSAHLMWRRRVYTEWEQGDKFGHLGKRQFRPQSPASENPIESWLESDMIRPYGEWIVEQVTSWDQWGGSLEKFLPGREHWRRYIDLITDNWGGRVRTVFHECATPEG